MRDDRLYLIYIGECIQRINDYTTGGRDAFFQDTKTQDAVLRNLHTLAESVQRVSPELLEKYKEVDWRAIIAFRNVIVHDYLGIDLDEIWGIIENDLPGLKALIASILQNLR